MSLQNSFKSKKLMDLKFFFWPVFPEERKLVVLLSSLIFLIWGVSSLIFPFQVSFLLTAPNSGAEVVGFLRTFILLPFGILFIIIYSLLYNKFGGEKTIIIFYVFFMFFYIVYAFYIVPYNSSLVVDPDIIAHHMREFPHLKWLFPLYGNWTYSLFYVFSALWITISSSQFFWQTANHFTQTHQASRLYLLFMVFGGLGSIIFSLFLRLLTSHLEAGEFFSNAEASAFLFKILSILNILMSILIMLVVKKIYNSFSFPTKKNEPHSPSSVLGGFHYFFHSSYLFFIFVTIFSYVIIFNLMGVIWKNELRFSSPTSYSYTHFLNEYTLWGGIGIIIFAYITKPFTHKRGWLAVALAAPLISCIATIPFFSVLFIPQLKEFLINFFQIDEHYLFTLIVSFQTIIMSVSISCLYFPTKEMTYIHLSKDMKFKGKVTTDIMGKNIGLAASGVIQEIFQSWLTGSEFSLSCYFLILIIGLFTSWILATKALGKKYFALIHPQ